MDIPWGDIASFSTAALSAVAGGGAWMAARRANSTADTVARIEEDRWHAELLPQFEISMGRIEHDRATLSVRLVGPITLCHLDEIRIKVVQSDDKNYSTTLPGEPTQEQVDAQVWGPLRFARGTDGVNASGKTVDPFSLEVGKGRPFAVERTSPPRWHEGDDPAARWLSQWRNKPMKLELTCRRDGFKDWVVPYSVEVPQRNRSGPI